MRASASPASAAVRRSIAFRLWVVLFFGANAAAVVLFATGHLATGTIVFLLPAPWFAYQVMVPSARSLGRAITHFVTDRREIWLTIDDGPDPATTPAILDLLEAHGARATFFVIGENAARHPELIAEILRRGHTLGNHTQTHPCWPFWCATAKTTAGEIDGCADTLERIGGGRTRLFRSPVGLKNVSLHRLLAARGMELILWSARGFDGITRDPETVLRRISHGLKPGAIVLVHEGKKNAADRVETARALLQLLAREGYACVIPAEENWVRPA